MVFVCCHDSIRDLWSIPGQVSRLRNILAARILVELPLKVKKTHTRHKIGAAIPNSINTNSRVERLAKKLLKVILPSRDYRAIAMNAPWCLLYILITSIAQHDDLRRSFMFIADRHSLSGFKCISIKNFHYHVFLGHDLF